MKSVTKLTQAKVMLFEINLSNSPKLTDCKDRICTIIEEIMQPLGYISVFDSGDFLNPDTNLTITVSSKKDYVDSSTTPEINLRYAEITEPTKHLFIETVVNRAFSNLHYSIGEIDLIDALSQCFNETLPKLVQKSEPQ